MLVPGITNPVEISYGPLITLLRDNNTRLVTKELEVYADGTQGAIFSAMIEADGIVRAADEAGLDTFHLVGYSAGGLAALAAIEKYPERLRSVTLIEPFGTGSYESSPEEKAFLDRAATVLDLPSEQRVAAFLPMNVSEGVEIAPAGPPPDWMEHRPAGVAALVRAARQTKFDKEAFRAFERPVYVVMGSLSNPAWYRMVDTLVGLFPNIKVEVYEGLHHLTPPQRLEPELFAEALQGVWAEGDALVEGGA